MADLNLSSLAANGGTVTLNPVAEHGVVKVMNSGKSPLRVEGQLNPSGPVWTVLFEGLDPCPVIDYSGTILRITNIGPVASDIRVGQ